MRLLKIVFIMAFLMISLVSAETLYYDDPELGLIKVEATDTAFQRFMTGLSNAFSITPSTKTPIIGEQVTINIKTEVPCKDASGKILKDSDVSSAKFIITDPDSRTTSFDIKSNVLGNGVCKSEDIKFTMTPNKKGKYYVHYIVMQSVYPQILVKEVNDFTVSSGSPQCQKEELTSWKTSSFVVDDGKVLEQSKYVYDLNCNLDKSKSMTYYKTQCDSEFLIAGSSQSVSEGIKQCVEKQEEQEKLPVPVIDSTSPVEQQTPTTTCTQDVKQPCEDGSEIVAYKCESSGLIPTSEQCLIKNEGSQGEISLIKRLFDLEFYGYYVYSLITIIIVGILVMMSIKPKRRR